MYREAAYPSFSIAIGLVILVHLIAGLTTTVLAAIPVLGSVDGLDIVGALAGYTTIIVYALSRNSLPAARAIPLRPIGGLGVLAVVASTLGLLSVQWLIDTAVVSVWPVPEWFEEMYAELLQGSAHLGIARVVVVAPVTEEVLVRGVFLTAFLVRYGQTRAILLSAVVFAVAHANPWQAIPAFFAGVLFAWWTLRAGSILPALIAHVVGNGIIYVATVTPEESAGFGGAGEASPWLPWEMTLAGVFLLALGTVASARLFRQPVAYHERSGP